MERKNKMKKRIRKGEHRYISYKKRIQVLKTLLFVFLGLIIFFVGLLLNQFEATNIFSVIAVLMVIPASKNLVNFIVFAKFSSIDDTLYNQALKLRGEEDDFYTDVVFTSREKIMFLSFLVVAGNEVIGLLGNEKQDEAYIRKYLTEGIKSRDLPYKVMICSKKDDFFRKYKKADRLMKQSVESRKELTSYLWSLIVE